MSARPSAARTPRPLGPRHARRRAAGLSLIELLIALAIISALLTATGVALDVSFKAYAVATQSASTQSSTRLLTNRLLTNIRSATAHGPLSTVDENGNAIDGVTLDDNTLVSDFIAFVDRRGDAVELKYDAVNNRLRMTRTLVGEANARPPVNILEGVTACEFRLRTEFDDDGVAVLRP